MVITIQDAAVGIVCIYLLWSPGLLIMDKETFFNVPNVQCHKHSSAERGAYLTFAPQH